MKTRSCYRVVAVLAIVGALSLLLRLLNRSLIVNQPLPSDVILVLSGDFGIRSDHAIDLAGRGFGNQIVIAEGSETLNFGRTLAERRGEQLASSAAKVSVCPIRADSTYKESKESALCLKAFDARRVLIVTSDFHARRSLAIFRDAIPSATVSVSSTQTDYSNRPWWSINSIGTSIREWIALIWWRFIEK